MPTFEVTITNTGATIVRTYHVEAEDEDEAKSLCAHGDAERVDEEVFDGDDEDIDKWAIKELT